MVRAVSHLAIERLFLPHVASRRRDIRFGILLRFCRATCTVPALLRAAHARLGVHRRYCLF